MKTTLLNKLAWGSVTTLSLLLSLGLAPVSHANAQPPADSFSQTSVSLPEEPSGEEPGPSIVKEPHLKTLSAKSIVGTDKRPKPTLKPKDGKRNSSKTDRAYGKRFWNKAESLK